MNLSTKEIGGGIILVPNFTLAGKAKKGFRPSYGNAMEFERAKEEYGITNKVLRSACEENCIEYGSGIFGADMKIHSVNDGPVNILITK
jgi:D-tyrosyl-tRNA(Tyr) deacylase